MTQQNQTNIGYGYAEETNNNFVGKFGLNSGITKMVKFAYTPNGGKDGTAQEALQIEFLLKGAEKPRSHNFFPVTEVYVPIDDNNNTEKKTVAEILASGNSKWIEAYSKAMTNLSATITHILAAYVPIQTVKLAFQQPIPDFKRYCEVAASILPRGFENEIMDVFIQYNWNTDTKIDEAGNDILVVYSSFPRKMTTGAWLCKYVPAVGEWHEKRISDPEDSDPKALCYIDDAGNEHPFTRNGYFMNRNWAKSKKERMLEIEDIDNSNTASSQISNNPAISTAAEW